MFSLSCPQRIVDDALHGLGVTDPRPLQGGGEPGVRREAGVGVDLQDAGVALAIDTEIHAIVAAEPEHGQQRPAARQLEPAAGSSAPGKSNRRGVWTNSKESACHLAR